MLTIFVLMQINILVCEQIFSMKKHSRQGKNPTVDEIKSAFVIDRTTMSSIIEENPLLLVVGITRGYWKHCLLLRRYCWTPKPTSEPSSLWMDLSRCWADREGLEVFRRGGSSGIAHVTELLFDFREAGLFPRLGSGVKLIPNGTTWTALYIRPFDICRSAVQFTYGQPQVGGSFGISKDLIEKHSALQWLVFFKMQAPYILLQVDCLISPSAVREQIAENIEASKDSKTIINQIVQVAKMNNFTYIQHPVGYHIDTFKNRKSILENKLCIMEPADFQSVGRGGGGRLMFVWALLDW